MKKCTKCNNLFLDKWKIVKLKSESEKQIFLKNNRKEICPHFDSTIPHISKKLSFDNVPPKPEIVDPPKVTPQPKPVVPDPLKINLNICVPDIMNAKDYHDFLMGRGDD